MGQNVICITVFGAVSNDQAGFLSTTLITRTWPAATSCFAVVISPKELDFDKKTWLCREDEDKGTGAAKPASGAADGSGYRDHPVDAARRALRVSIRPCRRASAVPAECANQLH